MPRVLIVILFAFAARSLMISTGSIAGSTVDESLGSVPHPHIEIVRTDGSVARMTKDGDEAGLFRLTGVPEGSYIITAKVPGFREIVRPLSVEAGKETLLGIIPLPFGVCNEPGGMICDTFDAKVKRVPEKIPVLTVCEALLKRDVFFHTR